MFIILSFNVVVFTVRLLVLLVLQLFGEVDLYSDGPVSMIIETLHGNWTIWLWPANLLPLLLSLYAIAEIPKLWRNRERHLIVRLMIVSGLFLATLLLSSFALSFTESLGSDREKTQQVVVQSDKTQSERNITPSNNSWELYESEEFGFTVFIPRDG